MRFLYREPGGSLSLTHEFINPEVPYAILSHTWAPDTADEVTMKQILDGSFQDCAGATKLDFCVRQATLDKLEYSWVDTCCIDKTNLAELSEAITSMYRWYQGASKCYVYLADVHFEQGEPSQKREIWESQFRASRWFRRGWTLQELLAPSVVEFYSREGRFLGTRQSLEAVVHGITGIPVAALQGRPLSQFTVAERFKWTAGRHTRRVEDRAYCLVGIFGITMTPRYGEGEQATVRLQRKANSQTSVKLKEDLLNWLAPSTSHISHSRALQRRHPGTNVLVQYPSVLKWVENDPQAERSIWITGKSGSGKTTLFAAIVEQAVNLAASTTQMPIAYHYCTREDIRSIQIVNILGSLISSISASVPSILHDLEEYFDADRRRGQSKSLQVWELEAVIARHAAEIGSMLFLIDALNESEDLYETVECVVRLLGILPSLKVLVTCTTTLPSRRIQKPTDWAEIHINADSDIRLFVEDKICNGQMRCRMSDEIRGNIVFSLLDRAGGSFRWIELAVRSVSGERTARNALSALHRVPAGLYELYASLVSDITHRDREIAREALKWVLFAARPLTLLELSEATVLTTSDRSTNQDARLQPPDMILEVCSSFLEADPVTGIVKAAHSSVRDFLLSNHNQMDFVFIPEVVHHDLMRKCLTYLMFDDFSIGVAWCQHELVQRQIKFPLLVYAANNWAAHAASTSKPEWKYAFELFDTQTLPRGGNYGSWARTLMPYYHPEDAVLTDPLYYAASLGFAPLVEAILSRRPGIDIDRPGGRHGSTPLQVACFRGQREAAWLLLAAGADFWSPDKGSDESSWFWASCNGWQDMVAKMLELRPEIKDEMQVTSPSNKWAKQFQKNYARQLEMYQYYREFTSRLAVDYPFEPAET